MSRQRLTVVVSGLCLLALGITLAVINPVQQGQRALELLVALVVICLALWKVKGVLDGSDGSHTVPWAPSEPFAHPAPERTRTDETLSSVAFAEVVAEGARIARRREDVEPGIEHVRPALRETLLDVMEQASAEPSGTERYHALARGTWTDDRLVASVLDPAVVPPDQSLRARVDAWLYPDRAVRRRVRRAIDAIAAVAEESLPAVPGQRAPRPIPVVRPRLEELVRGADGDVQLARDPFATARGPQPPNPTISDDQTDADAGVSLEASNDETIPATGDRQIPTENNQSARDERAQTTHNATSGAGTDRTALSPDGGDQRTSGRSNEHRNPRTSERPDRLAGVSGEERETDEVSQKADEKDEEGE